MTASTTATSSGEAATSEIQQKPGVLSDSCSEPYYRVPLITNNRSDYSLIEGLTLLSA
jgi:hypothetical protein